ncbi:unnamed protein product [Nippostrongylus brasiliensis]|uniref:HSCB_C domain-containing protein n=1 Tax=Nippostrongylus brasiliensis TaxID=27835 RepID=A0A0N4XVW6_NIPBR|nr:unnamed protein product [Nippostrongylus brasiliensis]
MKAGELGDESSVVMDTEEFEYTTLEERLIAMRGALSALEHNVNENYEKFKRTSSGFKFRLAVLEHFCREMSPAFLERAAR